MKGCEWVFHLAAYTKPVSKDPDLPYRTNVTGTINVLEAAKEMAVRKVIVTSTAGTMGYSRDGLPVGEETNKTPGYHTEYERTKAISEKAAIGYSTDKMDVILVNPTRVFGPGKLTTSNSLTRIIRLYCSGMWRIFPGDGNAIGNYVFIMDVVNGHILAALNGRGGERYILGGENHSYRSFFRITGEVYGKRRRLFVVPVSFLKLFVKIAGLYAKLTRQPTIITTSWIDKYLKNWIVSSDKAQSELNYVITPLEEGVRETIKWLKSNPD
jgi:farnesol dehydrogenase